MAERPSGTVTFLFTDIEGSTQLLQQVREQYPALLAAYRQLLRTIFQETGGHEVDTQGDAFFVAFPRARDALRAAVLIQQRCATYPWPEGITLRTRIGLHTGEPQLAVEGYVGLDVHRAARLCAAGHGGQVLLSQATRDLVAYALPAEVSLRDLGEHRLKDLDQPERIFQLVIADRPADFPPLMTRASRPDNLPLPATPLIGREREVAAVVALLRRSEVRLVTLTGTGGIGKTRLALQVAAELRDTCSDGVCFVALAPIRDPALVLATIAQTLGLKERGEQSLLDSLTTYLRSKHLLLVLDNLEQVVAAAPDLAALLQAVPTLTVVVTSRVPLHVSGEQEFPVPLLALPERQHQARWAVETLHQAPAVVLFVQRAQAVMPDFVLTDENAQAVGEICTRLDGLPLALELAAARIKLLPPQALLTRLSRRLTLLTGGKVDQDPRHHTLRATIDWSYQLLDAAEQQLFARLAVFVGGWTLEGAEAVCNADGAVALDVLDGLASLLDKSLIQQVGGVGDTVRFTMLETIREYALEQLERSGETDALQRAHATYYLALAEAAEQVWDRPEEREWLRRLLAEQHNLRAVLEWTLVHEEGTFARRLNAALSPFWLYSSNPREANYWLETALAIPYQERTPLLITDQAKILNHVGFIAAVHGDHARAHTRFEAGLALYQEIGNKRGIATSLRGLGFTATLHGHLTQAENYLNQSLQLCREAQDQPGLAWSFYDLGYLALVQGNRAQAQGLLEEGLARFRDQGNMVGVFRTVLALGHIMLDQGHITRAKELYQESLTLQQQYQFQAHTADGLEGLAGVAGTQGQPERAARLYGATEVLREVLATSRWDIYQERYARTVATARAQLGEAAFAAAWAEGRTLSLEQTITYALADDAESRAVGER